MDKLLVKSMILLADHVDIILKERRLTRADLCRTMGMTPQQMSRLFSGKVDARISVLDRISEALGIAPSDLLGGGKPKVVDRRPESQISIQESLAASVSFLDAPTAKVVSDIVSNILRDQVKDAARKRKV